jgi:hypothetical protein
MFKFSVRGKRAGRIVFGAVLLGGMALLVHRLATRDAAHAATLIPTTWVAAFAAYAIAGWLGSRRTLDHADELAVPALVVPSVGMALLLPLTLHLPVAALMSTASRAFDQWALLGLVMTGPTHLVFALLVGWRARQLALGVPAIRPMKIFGICVAVSCLPFVLIVLPPFIVMLTGIPLLALMGMMEPFALRDHDRAAAEALPRAIAVPALPRVA